MKHGYAIQYNPKTRFEGKSLTTTVFNTFEILNLIFYHNEVTIL